MLSGFRRRITCGNVAIVVVAIFVMTGGAYAAGKYVITSTKQVSPKVLKKLEGKPGAPGQAGTPGQVGPAGPTGATGATGPKGDAGTEGKEGKAGISVSSKELPEGNTHCQAGGSEFKAGATSTYACNGSPWTAGGTVPSGATLKGEWDATRSIPGALNPLTVAVSFGIPLPQAPATAHYIKVGEATPSGCTGTVSDPGAVEGNLCVFAEEEEGVLNEPAGEFKPTVEDAKTIGYIIKGVSSEEGVAFFHGTWAVTAE